MRALQCILFSLVFASGIADATLQFNLTPGITPVSHDIYSLHMTVFWVCVAIGILVFGTMLYSIIYHRKSLGVEAAQFHEHLWLELTWTIIPFFILVAIAIPGSLVLFNINDESKSDLTIKITGYQWKWQYEYLGENIKYFSNLQGKDVTKADYLQTVDQPLVVPIHKKIRFVVTSNDVIHSWWVPDFGIKRDAVPGFITESWARVNRAGIYHGQCAELCGIHHAYMPIVVVALPEKDFALWLAQKKGLIPPAPPKTPKTPSAIIPTTVAPAVTVTPAVASAPAAPSNEELMQRGQTIYESACVVCHQKEGAGMPPVYPSLVNTPMIKGPVVAHINRVLNGKPGTAMQAFRDQLDDNDLAAVITYERNAWGNSTGDFLKPEQIKAARALPPAP